MNTNVARARNTLHLHLESVDVLGLEDQADERVGVGKLLVGVVGQVALEATGVVRKTVTVGDGGAVGQTQLHRSKVNLHVFEGTALDAATTSTGREEKIRQTVAAKVDLTAARNEHAVARHRGVRAIKQWRVLKTALCGLSPVPVRLVALVAALIAESLLVLPGEVAVPSEEGTGVMNRTGLVDVGAYPVVES